jgi:hypothetical protein
VFASEHSWKREEREEMPSGPASDRFEGDVGTSALVSVPTLVHDVINAVPVSLEPQGRDLTGLGCGRKQVADVHRRP